MCSSDLEGEMNQLRSGMGFVGRVLSTAMWEFV